MTSRKQNMIFVSHYDSPLGILYLAADEEALKGVWFEGQKYFAQGLPEERREAETPVLTQTKDWLDIYFSGEKPDFLLKEESSAISSSSPNIIQEPPKGSSFQE